MQSRAEQSLSYLTLELLVRDPRRSSSQTPFIDSTPSSRCKVSLPTAGSELPKLAAPQPLAANRCDKFMDHSSATGPCHRRAGAHPPASLAAGRAQLSLWTLPEERLPSLWSEMLFWARRIEGKGQLGTFYIHMQRLLHLTAAAVPPWGNHTTTLLLKPPSTLDVSWAEGSWERCAQPPRCRCPQALPRSGSSGAVRDAQVLWWPQLPCSPQGWLPFCQLAPRATPGRWALPPRRSSQS